MSGSSFSFSPATDAGHAPGTAPSGRGFHPAGDPALLLAASDGHPDIPIVLDVEQDTVNIRSAGVDA